ncbi:MAG TPA: TrbC/VirB2 family protein [Chthoniobacterales bacterium]
MHKNIRPLTHLFAVGLALLAFVPHAHAAGGGGLPWESPLTNLANSFTGPVPYAISLLGIVVTGATVIFGGELGFFVRGLLVLVLVIAMIIAAKNFMSGLGLGAGAEIAAIEEVYRGVAAGAHS